MCFSSKYLVLPYEPFRDHISFHLLCYVFFHNILPCIFKLTPLKDKTWSPCERRKKDLTVVSFCHALFYLQTTITKLLNLLFLWGFVLFILIYHIHVFINEIFRKGWNNKFDETCLSYMYLHLYGCLYVFFF